MLAGEFAPADALVGQGQVLRMKYDVHVGVQCLVQRIETIKAAGPPHEKSWRVGTKNVGVYNGDSGFTHMVVVLPLVRKRNHAAGLNDGPDKFSHVFSRKKLLCRY